MNLTPEEIKILLHFHASKIEDYIMVATVKDLRGTIKRLTELTDVWEVYYK